MTRHVDSKSGRIRSARFAAMTAAMAGIALLLGGCGSSVDGTYYVEDVNGSSDLGRLVIKGDKLEHTELECEGVYDDPSILSTGEFNDDKTQVTWLVAGDDERNERVGTESVTISDNSITIGDDVYVLDDSDAGKAMTEAFEADCQDD